MENSDAKNSSLLSPSFQGLLWTNWLTAINDNIFRWFVIGVGKKALPVEYHTWIVTLGLAFFVAPYLILASPAGWLADRYRKRNVIIACKVAEIIVMTLGFIAVSIGSFYFLMFTVFLMGAQSALFAPAKVGTIPELLDESTISTGNGFFNLATLSATIIGMYLGAVLSDATEGGTQNLYIAGLTMIGIAVVGTVLSFLVHTLPAADKNKRFPYTIVGDTIRDVVNLARMGRLFRVALGIAFFWTVAGIAQLYIDQLADEGGALFETERTPLLICVTLGIGIGSVLAGMISAGKIELRLVPWGAAGISLFSMAMIFAPDYFLLDTAATWKLGIVGGLLAGIGISAGFFDVPLASYLQQESPIEKRGSILAATNFMIFSGMLVGSIIFGTAFRLPTDHGEISKLPMEYQMLDLTQEQQESVASVASDLHNQIKDTDRDRDTALQPIQLDVDEALKKAVITQVVWKDLLSQRKNIEQQTKIEPEKGDTLEIDTEKYSELFPQYRRQVKLIVRQAAVQPLMSSRQIFFLVGMLTIPVFLYSLFRVRAMRKEMAQGST